MTLYAGSRLDIYVWFYAVLVNYWAAMEDASR